MTDKAHVDCPYPGCFFCLMKDINPAKRRVSIAKFFKDLPNEDEEGQVIPVSGLWNTAMVQPSDPEFIDLGIFECMAALIWKGLTNRRWLAKDQNIYIPYYAAHIIGSYTMVIEDFAERAIAAGVIPALLELLRGRLTWVEQRVAVRALGHLATYDKTFPYVAAYKEILELAMELASSSPELVYTHFYQFVDRRLTYHCDLLTRGVGGLEMESRNAEAWASQLQCWSLQLINCFAFKEEFLSMICKPDFLFKISSMWGGLVNENSPAGVGLLRTICHQKSGRLVVSEYPNIIEVLCNIARSSDDWQYMALDCLVWLVQDPNTRYKVFDKAVATLLDLSELPGFGVYKKIRDLLVHTYLQDSASLLNSKLLHEISAFHKRQKWEKSLPREDLQIKLAASLVVKLEGNAKFSAGDVVGACSKYTEALELCPIKAKKERVTLYSNRAQCHLLLGNAKATISDTTRALCLHKPVNRHAKSLWRRAQAYDYLGYAKESLLDAIMFINECSQASGAHLELKKNKITESVERLLKRQMQATWLFSEAVAKHGGIQYDEDDDDDDDDDEHTNCSQAGDDESEWETASESDIADEVTGGSDSDQEEWHSKSNGTFSRESAAVFHGVTLKDLLGPYYEECY